ncbi:hypothetical protein F7725_002961 [Dissostichus mawsoni]|uniref:C2H2-type domain-containing protein n=1 Tax=Dissostichus mawsoni TaxID=36200 RepID=A0A7J5Y9N9_DISMA|nr:hypothetical protein F7725_002961 [Dissostichus mawsoni]
MDTSWSNFLFQTPSTQSQPETPLQSELLPELSGSAQSPQAEHIASPPSTVDTAALSEEPLPVKPLIKPGRPAHICSTCNKEFKNSYNLRRHQSVHTGIKMKDRAAREKEDGGKVGGGGRVERQTVPLSLLHLTLPQTHSLPHNAATGAETLPLLGQQQDGLQVAVSIAPATNPNPNPSNTNTVRKNHACEACGKAFRDVYHLNRHRLSHSDEKPYFCPVCQQRFKRKDRMSYHVRSHQGGVEKPYMCTSAFATRDRLRAHLVRHEEKVPCHICGKLLSAAYITDHMRVHNQAQHHSCHLCNRSFTTLTYLRVHAQKHHGQEWKESGGARGALGDGGRRCAAVPAVRGAVQDGHAAPGSHGHPRRPGRPRPRPRPRPHQRRVRGLHQRGRHRVQRQHRGTAGDRLLRDRTLAPQLAGWEGRGCGWGCGAGDGSKDKRGADKQRDRILSRCFQ